ncbi:MAG: hypothetical protein JWL76_2086 [Thermoleophilia bacterium]|nr:hypothetical protein [Thermoleophilia bacterium]
MNFLIHDLACAIERDANDDATDGRAHRTTRGRAAWIAEWQPRFDDAPVEPRRDLRSSSE